MGRWQPDPVTRTGQGAENFWGPLQGQSWDQLACTVGDTIIGSCSRKKQEYDEYHIHIIMANNYVQTPGHARRAVPHTGQRTHSAEAGNQGINSG